ncbi:Hypothetical predicted protein [Olea europaea subsp. europaea]|uniref:Uncharacterized protein n=1 Tax=Olea europaea subsp. europaea TaxID=158383 RepID=A0A8S0SZZ0_OLEEU|nr:Hypothetical predicted protein [Olea europaea subsp. europaea]
MACTPYPRNCLEMLENQAASLPWSRHVPNVACKSLPRNHLEIHENQAASLRILDITCTPCPKNCQKMPGNQVAFLSRSGRVPDMACTSCPKTTLKCLKIKLRPRRGSDVP